MTFEEFLKFRDVKIKNEAHKKIVKLFFPYLASVTGDSSLLPSLIGQLLHIDLSNTATQTGCFNGIHDGSTAPFENVDFYIRFENDVKVFIYGKKTSTDIVSLGEKEFVIFVLTDSLTGKITREASRYTYILD